MQDSKLKAFFNHTLMEMEIQNIWTSLQKVNFEKLKKAHDSIHEFISMSVYSLPENKEIHEKSAFFYVYLYNIFYYAHRAFLEALSGYYSLAYTLLRTALESTIRGAFLECIAHEEFRNRIKKFETRKGKKTIFGWVNDLIEQRPEIRKELEKTSASIFDKTGIIFKNRKFQRQFIHIPVTLQLIGYLQKWNILNSITYPKTIYRIYDKLSKYAHAYPDYTEVGIRLLGRKALFETDIIPKELNNFLKILNQVIDISTVVELNILDAWIKQDKKARNRLKERLPLLENLGLRLTCNKINFLLK